MKTRIVRVCDEWHTPEIGNYRIGRLSNEETKGEEEEEDSSHNTQITRTVLRRLSRVVLEAPFVRLLLNLTMSL